jgi:hypothetical protein
MSSGDKEVADMGNGFCFVGCAVDIIDRLFDREFLGP